MAVSYGTYTITEVQEGSQIWTTTVAPTTPDYTFTISNLSGDSQTSIKVGDIILYSFYRYTVSSINDNGTTVLTGNRTSIRGASGADSTTYILIISNSVITKDKNSNYSPTSITLTSKYQTGANVMTNYYGRFKIETTTDNETWTTVYTSNTNESTKTYSIPTNIVAVRCGLYLADGTTTLLDQQTIPIISDGVDGNDGEDAYTIILTNENHTFAGDTTSALASEIQCNIIGYKGATQMATTIGTITGQPTGMTTTVSNNDTTNASFTVSVTTSMVTKNGVLTIPITIDGKNFDKEFSYSLALNGQDGKDGGRWYSGTNITGTSTTATVFSDSGISSAVIGDMYLNTSTYNTYRCTVAGSASVAKWVYVNNIKGQIGDTGKGISSIVNQYILTTSNTTVPSSTDSNWSTTVPNYETGKYYWTKSHITWTDGTETDTTPVLDNGITSANSNAEDARKVATNYLSIDDTGIMVADMEDGTQTPSGIESGNNVFIDSSSVNIRDGQDVLAKFGVDGMIVGKSDDAQILVTNASISGISSGRQEVFSIAPVENVATYVITEGSENIVINATSYSNKFYYNNTPLDETEINFQCVITYENTQTGVIKSQTIANDSFVCDKNKLDILIVGVGGTGVGNTQATGYVSLDYRGTYYAPNITAKKGYILRTISFYITMTISNASPCSYTFGTRSGVRSDYGANSFTGGTGLIANAENQIAFGKYNEYDENYTFMIGNGHSNNWRSNSFTVDFDGNVDTGHINAIGGLTSLLDTSGNAPISVVDVNDDIMFSVGRDGSVMASGIANISGAVSCGDDLHVNGQITIPTNKYLNLADSSDYTTPPSANIENNIIYSSEYGDGMNTYYCAQNYHAFYAGGSGKMYIYDDKTQVNGAFNATGTISQNGTAVSLSTHTHTPNIRWKAGSYKTSSLASGYTDVTSNVTFPNLSGYTKCVLVTGTNSAYTGVTGAYIDSNNYIHFRCRNFATSASTPTISFFMIYLKDSCKWT